MYTDHGVLNKNSKVLFLVRKTSTLLQVSNEVFLVTKTSTCQ